MNCNIMLWILCLAAAVGTENDARINPSVRSLNSPALCFYASFDNGQISADTAAGEPEPINVKGNPEFKVGIWGKSLYMQDGEIIFDRTGNMPTASASGTLCFWICPSEWDMDSSDQRNVTFFRANLPYSGITRQGGKTENKVNKRDKMLVFYCNRKIRNTQKVESLQIADDFMKNDKWIFISLRWTPQWINLCINAAPPGSQFGLNQRKEYSSPMSTLETSGPQTFSFCFEKPMSLDEVLIFNRILSDKELTSLYSSLAHIVNP